MLYRIFTEDKNRRELLPIISKQFPGFTVIEATGYWLGKPEKSLVIEIMTRLSDDTPIMHLAGLIQDLNNQEAVLVQVLEETHTFVGRG